ncbi:hypothetical protein J7I93_06935 [Bacillus sp. ISL-47]|uniref:hypothetical protein n=1 Tax=Bacillus sp. ISL-47 TaxID=2819130 RepID=UPI001BE7E7D0|nr:hypothetical protein [Bacillus sp. ISL-47]MBT2687910.1 hypothetical protein [Bacillus sp. ISL-47]MBT2708013.1 hypothetical protein [Pseudomonas sp. ISL-84]
MLYLFLSMTLLLCASYFIKADISPLEKKHIYEMNGFVVVSIIAALSAKGLLMVHNKELFTMTLGELEGFLAAEGLPREDWAKTCMSIGENCSLLDDGLDLDFA